jgi:hypothetical protein
MKTERCGNDAAVEIQRLTASKLLPQLTQDTFFLCARHADIPRRQMPVLQMSWVVFRSSLNAGGAGGLRSDFEFAGRHFSNEKKLNPAA